MSKIVHYLCYAVDEKTKDKLIYYPSAQPKIEYLRNLMKKNEYYVKIVSNCKSKKGWFGRKSYNVDDKEQHIFFSSFHSKSESVNKVSLIFEILQTAHYLLTKVKKGDIVLVYHSLFYKFPFALIEKVKKIQFILEMEEIYSALSDQSKKYEKGELQFAERASAYLMVNDLLQEKIPINGRDCILSYGNYQLPPILIDKKKDVKEQIDVVYAGVVEQKRYAAFVAARTAELLDTKYRMHILGFGEPEDIEALKQLIAEVNNRVGLEKVKFHGAKSGNDYYKFLQSCDVALSCHSYDATMSESADYTFPSKIIVYLANGLQVVSGELRCVRQSQFGDLIHFYKDNKPKSIAEEIQKIDFSSPYDSRSIINHMNLQFEKDFIDILEKNKVK